MRLSFNQPMEVSFGSERLSVGPYWLGARAKIPEAVTAALAAPAGTLLSLKVTVARKTLRTWVARRAKAFDRKPVSARIRLVGLRPRIVDSRAGRKLVRLGARSRLWPPFKDTGARSACQCARSRRGSGRGRWARRS